MVVRLRMIVSVHVCETKSGLVLFLSNLYVLLCRMYSIVLTVVKIMITAVISIILLIIIIIISNSNTVILFFYYSRWLLLTIIINTVNLVTIITNDVVNAIMTYITSDQFIDVTLSFLSYPSLSLPPVPLPLSSLLLSLSPSLSPLLVPIGMGLAKRLSKESREAFEAFLRNNDFTFQ
jgi:hypothetical protein